MANEDKSQAEIDADDALLNDSERKAKQANIDAEDAVRSNQERAAEQAKRNADEALKNNPGAGVSIELPMTPAQSLREPQELSQGDDDIEIEFRTSGTTPSTQPFGSRQISTSQSIYTNIEQSLKTHWNVNELQTQDENGIRTYSAEGEKYKAPVKVQETDDNTLRVTSTDYAALAAILNGALKNPKQPYILAAKDFEGIKNTLTQLKQNGLQTDRLPGQIRVDGNLEDLTDDQKAELTNILKPSAERRPGPSP